MPRRRIMSDKIRPQHLERKAILYIRQSSAYQVTHNLESQKLQYAMEQRLRQLGWREIEIVDEDLGRSAAGTVARTGFERMVSEVCLGKVGAVAAREVSRFARNSREWQRLEKHPDRRVQQAVSLVFRKFGELGTVRQTLLWFLEHGLQLPTHIQNGE